MIGVTAQILVFEEIDRMFHLVALDFLVDISTPKPARRCGEQPGSG